jgi:hypothetical protein
MKIKSMLLAVTLVSFSSASTGFDFGKLLEERLSKELNKDKPTQPAPAQTTSPPSSEAQSAAASPPPANQKIDARQLGFAPFGDYSPDE